GFLQRKDELQFAQIMRERYPDLDDLRRRQELSDRRGEIHALQREQIHRARGGRLHEARQVMLALAECGPRLGIEAEDALRADIRHRAPEILRRGDEANVSFVAPDRQLVDFLAGDRAARVGGQCGRAQARSVDAEQLDFEDQRRVGRNHAARAARAVAELGGDGQAAIATDLHPLDAFVPTLDDFAPAERKSERIAAIATGVELASFLSAVQQPTGVMHGDFASGFRFGAGADRELLDDEPAGGRGFRHRRTIRLPERCAGQDAEQDRGGAEATQNCPHNPLLLFRESYVMPLSAPAPRRHLHTRNITCEGYARDDGLWDIEARIVDTKTYRVEEPFRGVRAPGMPVHDMQLRLTLDRDMVVREIEVTTNAAPYDACPSVAPNYKALVGAR